MSQDAIPGNSSYAAVTLPVKQGRGRPRKDSSLKRVKTVHCPPGFKQTKEIQPQQVDRVNVADDGMIEENDVAPHVPMIKRNDFHLPVRNQVQVHGHDQRPQVNVSAPTAAPPSGHFVGAHGAVVPVVHQPVNPTNGSPPTMQAPPDSSQGALKERSLQTVAPLAMLPPDGSLIEATKGVEASYKLSAGNLNVVQKRDVGDMNEPPSVEPSDSMNSPLPTSVSKPLMNYGIGRMTELLQAVQENLMQNQVLRAGESSIGPDEEPVRTSSPKTDG